MRDSCGSSGTDETPQAFTPRRPTARPPESEHLEGKSTTTHYLVNSNKVCETAYEKERNADKGQSQKKYKQKEIPQKNNIEK
ncbi:hypothetical protein SAMN05444672_104264 [Bacillus sp. OK838]|nr:hypothetical protein SAMN05444672_104264 [Bacillus sp. OK838]